MCHTNARLTSESLPAPLSGDRSGTTKIFILCSCACVVEILCYRGTRKTANMLISKCNLNGIGQRKYYAEEYNGQFMEHIV